RARIRQWALFRAGDRRALRSRGKSATSGRAQFADCGSLLFSIGKIESSPGEVDAAISAGGCDRQRPAAHVALLRSHGVAVAAILLLFILCCLCQGADFPSRVVAIFLLQLALRPGIAACIRIVRWAAGM